jgi:hypothetical protein
MTLNPVKTGGISYRTGDAACRQISLQWKTIEDQS